MPDDSRAQIEPLIETIRALGWPLVVVDGVEADDVIGTLAREAERARLARVDLHRRQGPHAARDRHVTLVNTMSNETLDAAGVKEKFGVRPSASSTTSR